MENATPDGLLALGHVTKETDQANPDPAQRAEQEKEAEKARQAEVGARAWAGVMGLIGRAVCMIEPKLTPVYSRDACLAWGEAANSVAEKYGWNSPDDMPELALLTSTAFIAVPTVLLLREKMQEVKDGNATGLAAKIGIWWRTRKARKAAAGEGAGDGRQQ